MNEWAKSVVYIFEGSNHDETLVIKSNTIDTITVNCDWTEAVDGTSQYLFTKKTTWADETTIADDNKIGPGTTKLTWDLK